MAKTLAQIQQQIQRLQEQAEAIRKKEVVEVIKRIKEAIAHYELTADDLGFGVTAKRVARTAKRGVAAPKTTKGKKAKTKGVARYGDANGNTWTGVGRKPRWFVEALGAGKTPEELLLA